MSETVDGDVDVAVDGDSDTDERSTAGGPLGTTNVAIACQGGGSHTAFTAGVLRELLRTWDDDHELVGISGTSGGAFNALVAWYNLLAADRDAAVDALGALWDDLGASSALDRLRNDWLVGYSRVESGGFPVPQVSPYRYPPSRRAQADLRDLLTRHVDFESIPGLCAGPTPELVVGTVDVNGGEFETFSNEAITPEVVLASAAVPNLFEGVAFDGHLHWDGLFSQNPPIDDLMTLPPSRKPDELWVIQINPQTRDGEPTSLEEIADRRNELSGNISLNQEIRFLRRVNEWVEAGYLPADRFARTEVRRIELGRELHCSTKLDRDPAFIGELLALGEARAAAFREDRRRRGGR